MGMSSEGMQCDTVLLQRQSTQHVTWGRATVGGQGNVGRGRCMFCGRKGSRGGANRTARRWPHAVRTLAVGAGGEGARNTRLNSTAAAARLELGSAS